MKWRATAMTSDENHENRYVKVKSDNEEKCDIWFPCSGPLVTKRILTAIISNKGASGDNSLEPGHEAYLIDRWAAMVMWWHARSVYAKWKYLIFRSIVIVGGVLIPVLSAAGMNNAWKDCALIWTAIIGAVVAAAAAWEGVANYGETWREKRRAAELLKVEGWLFLNRSGKYKAGSSYAAAFPSFVAEVETKIAAEVGQYLAVFDASLARPNGPPKKP
jgi:Protein of unknown function (DUF4231)